MGHILQKVFNAGKATNKYNRSFCVSPKAAAADGHITENTLQEGGYQIKIQEVAKVDLQLFIWKIIIMQE